MGQKVISVVPNYLYCFLNVTVFMCLCKIGSDCKCVIINIRSHDLSKIIAMVIAVNFSSFGLSPPLKFFLFRIQNISGKDEDSHHGIFTKMT